MPWLPADYVAQLTENGRAGQNASKEQRLDERNLRRKYIFWTHLLQCSKYGDGWLSLGRWVCKFRAKFVAHLLAKATLRVQIQTSPKNTKWATYAKEWPTHSSRPKKYIKNKIQLYCTFHSMSQTKLNSVTMLLFISGNKKRAPVLRQ